MSVALGHRSPCSWMNYDIERAKPRKRTRYIHVHATISYIAILLLLFTFLLAGASLRSHDAMIDMKSLRRLVSE